MKLSIVAIATLLYSCISHSQPINFDEKSSSPWYKGFYLGIDYMNATESDLKFESERGSFEDNSTIHLGLIGITTGYSSSINETLDYSVGSRLLEPFNRSEYYGNKFYFLVPEFKIKLPIHSLVKLYGGVNATFIAGSSLANKSQAQLGAQAGVDYHVDNTIKIGVGYSWIRFAIKDNYGSSNGDDYDATIRYQMGGFRSDITYIF